MPKPIDVSSGPTGRTSTRSRRVISVTRGQVITYRNGQSGTVITVDATGPQPIYTQSETGQVIAHRPDGRVSERVEGQYDIVESPTRLWVAIARRADGEFDAFATRTRPVDSAEFAKIVEVDIE